jgi:hypothetical protein
MGRDAFEVSGSGKVINQVYPGGPAWLKKPAITAGAVRGNTKKGET